MPEMLHPVVTPSNTAPEGRKYPRATFLIPFDPAAREELAAASRDLGLGVTLLKEMPEVGTHELTVPRIAIPIDYGLVDGLSIVEPRKVRVRGSVLSSEIVDKKSPITLGYEDKLALYFPGALIFNLRILKDIIPGFARSGQQEGGRQVRRPQAIMSMPDLPRRRACSRVAGTAKS